MMAILHLTRKVKFMRAYAATSGSNLSKMEVIIAR